MNRGAQFNGSTRRARAQKHTDNISLFSKTTPLRVTLARGVWHSSRGQAALPGEAGPLQGRRTWAIGFTVNTKCKSASEPWEMRHDIKATVPGERRKMRTAGRKSTGGGQKQVATLQSRRVLWIMGDNVTADFCRRSQWCRVSFFMDSITHCFSFLLFLFYTAVNNTPLHALGGPVFFLELFRRWAQFTCHHFLHNEIISFFRRPN